MKSVDAECERRVWTQSVDVKGSAYDGRGAGFSEALSSMMRCAVLLLRFFFLLFFCLQTEETTRLLERTAARCLPVGDPNCETVNFVHLAVGKVSVSDPSGTRSQSSCTLKLHVLTWTQLQL